MRRMRIKRAQAGEVIQHRNMVVGIKK
jgi:hypothetical protein